MKISSSDFKLVAFSIFTFILQSVIQGLPVAILTFLIGGIFLAIMHQHDKKKYDDFKSRLDEASFKSKELALKIEEQQKFLQKY